MRKIALVNPPFASVTLPSIALTQLRAVARREFPDEVSVDIVYLNQDFAKSIGVPLYQRIAGEGTRKGLGDWLFRELAFPGLEDTSNEYFACHYPRRSAETGRFREQIRAVQASLEGLTNRLIEKYQLAAYDMVGFTSMFSQNTAAFAVARRLKEINDQLLTIMGGANCESPMGEEIAANLQWVDYIFSGPANRSFPKFLRAWLAGQFDLSAGTLPPVPGIIPRHGLLNRPVLNMTSSVTSAQSRQRSPSPPAALITLGEYPPPGEFPWAAPKIGLRDDIDEVLPLDYDDFLDTFEANFSDAEIRPILLFETSRGCWWGEQLHCTFCGLNGLGMKYQAMSPSQAIKQIKSLFRYAERSDLIESVDNILPKTYLTQVLPFLNTPPCVTLFYEVKVNLTDEELRTMADAGLRWIQPGIEALATSTLTLMKKGTTAFQNLMLLRDCLKHDIRMSWNLLIGFPGEGQEVYEQYDRCIPKLAHLEPPSGVFPVRFDRYSPYFENSAEYGLVLKPCDFYEQIYPFSAVSLRNLAYYFIDTNDDADYIAYAASWLPRLEAAIDRWRNLWERGPDQRPELRFVDEDGTSDAGFTVLDSRSGKKLVRKVSPDGKAILTTLAKPRSIAHLVNSLGLPSAEVEREVRNLADAGLVFEERDRFLSLVAGTQVHRSRKR